MKITFKKFKKTAITAIAFALLLGGNLSLVNLTAQAASIQKVDCSTLQNGDNIKADYPAIWNIGSDGLLRPYLDGDDFKTWHTDDNYEGHYKLVTSECIASFSAAGESPLYMNRRSGSGLIRKIGDTQLYAILPNNVKAAITVEAAKALYGQNYPVRDIILPSWLNYFNTSTVITGSDPKPHAGMLVSANTKFYYVNNNGTFSEFEFFFLQANNYKLQYVHPLSAANILAMQLGNALNTNTTTPAIPPVTPTPAPKTGTLALALDNSLTPADRQVLTGSSYNNILTFTAKASDEDVKLESIKIKIVNSGLGTPDKIITNAKLINTQTAVSYGSATISKVGSDWQASWSNFPSFASIDAGNTGKFAVILDLATNKNAAGGIIKFDMAELTGKGLTTQNTISANTTQIKSNKSYVVTTKPKITVLTPTLTSLQGGSQLEFFRFKVEAEDNTAETTKLTLSTMLFTINRTNVSMKNLKIYYLDNGTWKDGTLNCHLHLLPKWSCVLDSNSDTISDGQNRTYSLRADLGLNGSASIQTTLADLGSAATKSSGGDVSWFDNIQPYGTSTQSADFYWVDQKALTANTITGSGIGALYDKQGPQVLSITLQSTPATSGTVNKNDAAIITFDEQTDPTSIKSGLPQYTSADVGADEQGSAIICLDGVGQIDAFGIRGVLLYSSGNKISPSNTCKKYSANIRFNDEYLVLTLNDDGASIPTTFVISYLLKDANGNTSVQSTMPTPTGSF